jgi:hypothetical protein
VSSGVLDSASLERNFSANDALAAVCVGVCETREAFFHINAKVRTHDETQSEERRVHNIDRDFLARTETNKMVTGYSCMMTALFAYRFVYPGPGLPACKRFEFACANVIMLGRSILN